MERLMQYVWQHRLWTPARMRTVDGRRIEVLDPGWLNSDAGPDFFNAKVKIDDNVWVGNIELHVKASDWYRHGHHNDPAYDSVVLHVVANDDRRVTRSDGNEIPQLVMPCSPDFANRYNAMVNNPLANLACGAELRNVPQIYVTDWLSSLAIERINAKTDRIFSYLKRLDNYWDDALYVTLARALGFNVNSDAFERLALATPFSALLRHRMSLDMVEGALFGQAGLIPSPPIDEYTERLAQQHAFFCRKFSIRPPGPLGWRLARTRPQNFPHRRIATLAAMVHQGFSIARDIFNVKNENDARMLFNVQLEGYWSDRYTYGSVGTRSSTPMSQNSISILIINVVVPMLYSYGLVHGDTKRRELALELLQGLAAERNSVVQLFKDAGVQCEDALTSQALLQLRRNYCESRKCLYCRIGHRLLAAKVLP